MLTNKMISMLQLALWLSFFFTSTWAFSAPNPKSSPNVFDTFDTFIEMRTGFGKGNGASEEVYWMGEGQLYDSPSGKILANVDGFDVSRGIEIADGHVRQFSRKIFWFRDPGTNEIMTEYKGKPVKPIKYDWQVFDLKRGENEADPSMTPILPSVLKGPRLVPCMPVIPRFAGKEQMMFQCPLFIDVETHFGRYQAWEFYDYIIDTTFNENRPPSLAWSRQGPNPPFNADSGVMHFMGHRLTSFEDLPEHIQKVVNEDYPLFQSAPDGMEEVEMLEAALQTNGKS
mmetsp:Transcript_11678/g.17066  ORF Transcript_11678/g.17066 Transcript_11678/m.17066 type:complete len:285 (-) Transcript_11678:287-1141(-)